ncbi:MAG: hypothetical protein QOH57_1836, partial [Mycobacterium sp.]|nr:hypothetical protein [Mycobacterium sp.]
MSDELICPECGTANPAGSAWCSKDGAFLAWKDGGGSPGVAGAHPAPHAGAQADGPRSDVKQASGPMVAGSGDPPRTSGIRIHPPAARIELVDTRPNSVQVAVDNTAKHDRHLTLSASDPEHVLQFHIEPREVLLKPNQRVMVELRVTAPPPRPGTATPYTVTIVAEEAGHPVGRTAITLDQRTSTAPKSAAPQRPKPNVRQSPSR